MELIYQISIVLFILFGGCYAVLICLFTIGWFRLKDEKDQNFEGKVSVLIPVRNEAQTIGLLLEDLKNQSASSSDFDVLIIDDHSEDATPTIVSDFCNQNPELSFKFVTNPENGKKEAIKQGVSLAKEAIIVCVDADCRVGSEWLSTMCSSFSNSKLQMISGPVAFFKEKSIFKRIQSLEFLSLIASGAGAIGMKLPFMCNGANLAFRKTAFTTVNGFVGNDQFASGDDVFLLHKIKKHYGSNAIAFIKNRDAIVETASVDSFKSFLQQRKRWASKSIAYKDVSTIVTSISVATYSLLLILLALFSCFNNQFISLFLFGVFLKMLIDFTLLLVATAFFQRKNLLWIYFPVQLIYPIYTALISLLAFFTKNEWKGRKID